MRDHQTPLRLPAALHGRLPETLGAAPPIPHLFLRDAAGRKLVTGRPLHRSRRYAHLSDGQRQIEFRQQREERPVAGSRRAAAVPRAEFREFGEFPARAVAWLRERVKPRVRDYSAGLFGQVRRPVVLGLC